MSNRHGSPLFFENREQNGIEVPSNQPDLSPAEKRVAQAEPPGTPRGAGKDQKRQSQPRTVGFEFWWWGAESNYRHNDFNPRYDLGEIAGVVRGLSSLGFRLGRNAEVKMQVDRHTKSSVRPPESDCSRVPGFAALPAYTAFQNGP